MRRAFAELYGTDGAFGRVEFSGRTETAIFSDGTVGGGGELKLKHFGIYQHFAEMLGGFGDECACPRRGDSH